jgi:membrane protein YqaA with SNARE-associated domain
MRALFYSLLGYFLTPAGVIAMGLLDSSLVFFLPLGIDFVVIVMAARKPELFWLYALFAAAGAMVGAGATFWLGRKLGEKGLEKIVSRSRLKRVQQRISERAAYSIAALGIIPPPFPFTAFVLTSGALKVDPWPFFVTLAAVRVLRFGVEGALAAHYGRGILAWTKSSMFQWIIGGFIVLAVIGTVVSGVAVWRSTRRRGE